MNNESSGFESNLSEKVLPEEEKIRELLKNIPYSDSKGTCNILLLAMSTFGKKVDVCEYFFDDADICDEDKTGYYVGQLEPTPKMLSKVLAKKGERLDYIYVLNTNETKNYNEDDENNNDDKNKKDDNETKDNKETIVKKFAFDYFKERCACIFDGCVNKRIIDIPIQKEPTKDNDKNADTSIKTNQEEDNIEEALYNFRKQITDFGEKQINLYIDNHGGPRNKAFIVDAISQIIIQKSNVKLIKTYTTSTKNGNRFGFSTFKSEEILDFVAGIKEFLYFGSAKSLNDFAKNRKLDDRDKDLIDEVNKISESIKLCNINSFISGLKRLNAITNMKSDNKSYLSIANDIIREDYKIREDQSLLEKPDNMVYALKWCTSKEYIQQALTMIESRTCEYLVENGIISFANINEFENENPNILLEIYNDWINLALTSGRLNRNTYYKKGIDEEIVICIKDCIEKVAENGYKVNDIYDIFKEYKNGKEAYSYNAETYKVDFWFTEDDSNKKPSKNNYYTRMYLEHVNKKKIYNRKGYCKLKLPYSIRKVDFIDALYNFLFIQKILKFLRNKLNHFSNSDEEINADYIKKLIKVYIVLLENLEEINKKYS